MQWHASFPRQNKQTTQYQPPYGKYHDIIEPPDAETKDLTHFPFCASTNLQTFIGLRFWFNKYTFMCIHIIHFMKTNPALIYATAHKYKKKRIELALMCWRLILNRSFYQRISIINHNGCMGWGMANGKSTTEGTEEWLIDKYECLIWVGENPSMWYANRTVTNSIFNSEVSISTDHDLLFSFYFYVLEKHWWFFDMTFIENLSAYLFEIWVCNCKNVVFISKWGVTKW